MAKQKSSNTHPISSIVIWVAGIIGFLDSMYLAYAKLANRDIYCTPGLGNCDVVNSSKWSELWGIPIAIFGMAAFGAILLAQIMSNRMDLIRKYQDYLLFGISFAGFLFSLYLTYIEIYKLRTICQWCVLSAIAMTTIFITTFIRLVPRTPGLSKQGGN